jgi:hypothetical protein
VRRTLIAVCAVVALAGCGGAPAYDEQQHRADVEAASGPVRDWPKLRDNMQALCVSPPEMFAFSVGINYAAGVDIDTHIRHLCPERLDEAHNVKVVPE